MKQCSRCKIQKEKGEFHRDNSRKDGLARYCRNCSKEHSAVCYNDPEKKEKVLNNGKNWRNRNKNKRQEKIREWRVKHKDKIEDDRLKKTYGISLEDYKTLLFKQNNCCAICTKNEKEFKIKLAVDHDHETGKVRGLLCRFCNQALGALGDNLEGIMQVVKYLNFENDHEK